MKMSYEHQAVQKSSNSLETTQSQILMTPEMLDLLSSGVYEHKERAVVRELSTNALDGHVMKGNTDEPFDIHVPTIFEPYFEVRDKGVGLSHEQVMNLYMNYGASTKNDSDDLIGAMGIGSKSPFAVSDSFTVRSYHGGSVTTYQAYKENGIPNITKLMTKPMQEGESTGLAVRVAVKKDMIQEFHRAASYVFETFKVKPNCNVELNYVDRNTMVLSEKKGEYTAFKTDIRSSESGFSSFLYIVMGSIRYPVDASSVFDSYSLSRFQNNPMLSAIGSIFIYIPIGSVAVSASRESLQMNTKTKDIIVKALESLTSEFIKGMQVDFDAIDNFVDAGHYWVKLSSSLTASAQRFFAKELSWKGKSIAKILSEEDAKTYYHVRDKTTGEPLYQQDSRGNLKLNPDGSKQKALAKYRYEAYMLCRIEDNSAWGKRNKWQKILLPADSKKLSCWYTEESEFDSVLFYVYDRVTKSGKEKVVGKDKVLAGMGSDFDDVCYLYPVDSKADAQVIWERHNVPLEHRHFAMASSYESFYIPEKKKRSVVKLWTYSYNDAGKDKDTGFMRKKFVSASEGDVDLNSLLVDGKEHLYLKSFGECVLDGIFQGRNAKDVAEVIAPLISGSVVIFRKANWNKVPDEWDSASDESVVRRLIGSHPSLWKALNTQTIALGMYREFHNLHRMGVHLEDCDDYYSRSDSGRIIQFKGACEIFKEILVRPCYSVRDVLEYYPHKASILVEMHSRMVSGKLHRKILRAKHRQQGKVSKHQMFKDKYKVLNFVDFDRVNLVELADALEITYDKSQVNNNGVKFYTY